MSVYLGTCSFSEDTWKGVFYPENCQAREYLSHYATCFKTVEIDATYYAIPSRSTVAGWFSKTPDDFIIAAKFPRSIVHCGDGPAPRGDLVLTPDATFAERDKFLSVISGLGAKLGPLLIQFPYFNKRAFDSPEPFFDRLDTFLATLPREMRFAVEIRNRNWLRPEFPELLKKHNVALALVDQAWMPHGDEVAELFDPLTTDFSYIRLIGDRKEVEAITDRWDKEVIDRTESLMRWAALIRKFVTRDINIYAYVNNHFAGHAPATARRLAALLKK